MRRELHALQYCARSSAGSNVHRTHVPTVPEGPWMLDMLLYSVWAMRDTPRSFQWNGCASVLSSMRKIRYRSFRFGYL